MPKTTTEKTTTETVTSTMNTTGTADIMTYDRAKSVCIDDMTDHEKKLWTAISKVCFTHGINPKIRFKNAPKHYTKAGTAVRDELVLSSGTALANAMHKAKRISVYVTIEDKDN